MQNVSTHPFNNTTEHTLTDWISAFIQAAVSNGFAAACWSHPESQRWDLIADPQPLTYSAGSFPLLHELAPGFVLSPFRTDSDTYYIHSRIHVAFDKDQAASWQIQTGYEYIKELIQRIAGVPDRKSVTIVLPAAATTEASTLSCYINGVSQAKEAIEAEKMQKVVFARSKDQLLEGPPIEEVLINLRTTYPHACIAVYYHPETGLWITATPELLLSVNAEGIFKTVALAGTQSYNPDVPVREVSWTHKEIEEQALVCRYIISCFKTIRLREYDEQGPRSIRAGNLLHLKTEYVVDTKEVNMPELGSTMLRLLHPTSAVCGMPKQAALEFIQKHEPFDRQLYSGFIGPVNMNNSTALYVNLRCARIYSNKITLFAGAGITADSIPQKEWEETSLKMDVIGRAFSNL